VACDDEAFRAVVADLLGHQRDMRVLRPAAPERADEGMDARGRATQGAVAGLPHPDVVTPDVVVYGISPRSEVTSHAPEYRDMASMGAAIVVFCTSPEQAADFEDLGVEYVVDVNEPARELAAAVRAAYRNRSGHTIH
jgi:hypothetical protein